MKSSYTDHLYHLLAAAVVGVIAIGTVFYHFVEHFGWIDAFYFSVVTLATVGYGDLVPKTDIGKLFTTVYILTGVGIFATFVSLRLKRRATRVTDKQNGAGKD